MKTFIEPVQISTRQPHEFIVVIDLEHVKGEIIEFPSLILDCATGCEVARFHRWVRPTAWDENPAKGPENAESNAIPFTSALADFEDYLRNSKVFNRDFICLACGNWDIGTQIAKDCARNEISIPPYFNQWVNWKDLAMDFYGVPKDLAHLEDMLNYLELPLTNPSKKTISNAIQRTRMKRFHDVLSISRVVRKMMTDGAAMEWTGRRDKDGRINYRLRKKQQVKNLSRSRGRGHSLRGRGRRKPQLHSRRGNNMEKMFPQSFV